VKIFPCAQVGGDQYIRALKVPLPQIKLIASGGVNQLTATISSMPARHRSGLDRS